MKGKKVINMKDIKKDMNYVINEDKRSLAELNDVEPTDDELMEIAKSEEEMLDNEEVAINDEQGNINVFGKNEVDIYFRQIGDIKVCTPEEEKEYLKKIAEGDIKARDEFIQRNLKLVISNAKYRNTWQNSTFSFMDLIQEGNIGLLKAIEKFDITKGYKFSTYATWWIRQAMNRGVAEQARIIRLPVHMFEWTNKYKKKERAFIQSNGRSPSILEMSEELGVSLRKATDIARMCQDPVSLFTPVGEDEESILGDFIQSEDVSVEEQYEQNEMLKIVEKLLKELSPREREVVIARFGIGTGKPKTLEEVGNMFNVTRERARQIEAKAIRKLKRCPKIVFDSAMIKDYLK